jgi:hypothetical protein
MDQDKAFFAQCLPEFKGSRALRDNKYLVEKNYKTHTVNTAIQEAVFTLDNAKFWYIKFVYDFIYKCMDLSKIHFIEGDTDTLYYAISGNQTKIVIKDLNTSSKMKSFTTRTCTNGSLIQTYLKKNKLEIKRNS